MMVGSDSSAPSRWFRVPAEKILKDLKQHNKLKWKSSAQYQSRNPLWRYANLNGASKSTEKVGFTQVGSLRFRKGKQVRNILIRTARRNVERSQQEM